MGMTWQYDGMSRMDDLLDAAPEQLSAREVAELLGVTERTIVRWLKGGDLPGFRLPRGWLVMREDLRGYLHRAYNLTTPGEDDAEPRT